MRSRYVASLYDIDTLRGVGGSDLGGYVRRVYYYYYYGNRTQGTVVKTHTKKIQSNRK